MLTHPTEYKSRPTAEDCAAALSTLKLTIQTVAPSTIARWNQEKDDCLTLRDTAGKPAPHNYDFAFSKVLIELSRVLANPFYLQSPARAANAEQIRIFFPRSYHASSAIS